MSKFPANLGLQFRFAGQVQLIAARKQLLRLLRPQRIFHDRIILVRTQDQAQRWVVAVGASLFVKIVDVKLKLSQVLVRQLANLEIDQHKALENGVVKNQVDIEMIAINRDPLLASDERETFAKFQKECL